MRAQPRLTFTAALVVWLSSLPAPAKDTPRFVWPGPPSAVELSSARAMASPSGLVVVDRRCLLSVRTLGAEPYGVVRDDYLRLLVLDEHGARNASIDVSDDPAARVTVVEGRTVAPDGAVIQLDADKDVQRVEASTLGRKRALATLAKVKFPASQSGALLDLHFVVESDEMTFAVLEPLAFGDSPLLLTDFRLTIKGGFPGAGWSCITVGKGRAQLGEDPMARGVITARLEGHTPLRSEPFGPPSHHEQMTLLAFVNLEALHDMKPAASQSYRAGVDIDSRGRIAGEVFDSPEAAKYWVEVLAASEKSDRNFLKREGSADSIDVAAAAPAAMPLVDRVAALYRLAQAKLVYNPDAEGVDSLGAMLKKGMPTSDHGTLLLAYLLDRAGIPYQVAQVCNRYSLRFVPAIHNEFLFDFAGAIVIRPPGGTPIALMPGELTLPFGALPDVYQESVALVLENGGVTTLLTPANAPGVDSVTLRYDLALDGNGDVEGTIRQEERGAPAWALGRGLLAENFAAAHPGKAEKKRGATAEKERKERIAAALADELRLPGDRMKADAPSLVRFPLGAQEVLELSTTARGTGIARRVGDTWVVNVYPLMAGVANPFVEASRRTPVWYPRPGRVVVEGDLRLPAGARVLELPKRWEIAGPDGTVALGSVVAGEAGGAITLHSRFEYDLPVSVAVEHYQGWKALQDTLARQAGDGALVTLPAAKVLE